MSQVSQDVSPRAELIGIQKRLLKRIKQSLYAEYCQTNPWIDAYYEDYKQLTGNYERVVSKAELLSHITESDVVYLGDYHTLRQAQRTLIRILEPIINSGYQKSIILGLEMFRAEHQTWIDQFLNGTIEEQDFLKKIDYEKTWGFDWNHYKIILNYAREHKIKVYGLNTPDITGKHNLERRDKLVGQTVVDIISQNSDTLFITMFGDLHISENHLPKAVDEVCAEKRQHLPRRLIICQNSERIYWKLADQGLEQATEAVKIKDRVYCIINSTPLMVFQSCLNWQYQEKDLKSCPMHPGWCEGKNTETLLPEEMAELVKAICNFLNLGVPPLDRFTICSAHDFDILDKVKAKLASAEEKERIEADLARTESYFIREAGLICLSNLSLNHAGEEAAHLIHYHYALTRNDKPMQVDRSPVDNFYYNIIREALGFFGSRVINHKRLCSKEDDFKSFITRYARKKVVPYWVRVEREIANTVLEHIKREKDYLSSSKWRAFRKIHLLKLDPWVGVSQSLGYILGDKLYNGVMQDIISRGEIRELFLKPFTERDAPLTSYLYLVRRTAEVKEIFGDKESHL